MATEKHLRREKFLFVFLFLFWTAARSCMKNWWRKKEQDKSRKNKLAKEEFSENILWDSVLRFLMEHRQFFPGSPSSSCVSTEKDRDNNVTSRIESFDPKITVCENETSLHFLFFFFKIYLSLKILLPFSGYFVQTPKFVFLVYFFFATGLE